MGARSSVSAKAQLDPPVSAAQRKHGRHKRLEEELKEERTITTPPDTDHGSPDLSPSPSSSPPHSPAASPQPSPSPSPTLRRRVRAASSSQPQVTTRTFYYRHEHESSDSDTASSTASRRRPPRRRCEWLHRRHFFLFSVLSLIFAYYLSTLPPSHYFADLPDFAAYLPDELHSSFIRLQSLVSEGTRPGVEAREEGIRRHFPVILIPGIISTALEVWEGEPCAASHFRQRLWGSSLMLRSILLDTRCWIRHMTLDSSTGMDPPGIKLRSSSGLEAADYIIGGFWVWAKVIQSLGDIGYETNSMMMAPYDWRLSFLHLQQRDFYFTKLKAMVEIAHVSNHQRKVVFVTHSMGALVIHYFLQWVQSAEGGGGGDRWVDAHVESIVNIGGPMLGVPKAYSALFSGEMKDTAELAPFLDYWRQRVVFSQADVIQIMRSIFSVPSMMPKGGDVIWGGKEGSPDDFFCKKYADVTRLLLTGGAEALSELDEDVIREYCDIIPHINRSARLNASAASSTSSLSASGDGSAAGGAGSGDEAAKVFAEGKLQAAPSHPVGQSFASMLEDSVLRHPSRWFSSHKEAQPYVSAKGSARGSFVTFTPDPVEHGGGADQAQCIREGGCDLTVDEAMELLRRTAPSYMNFTESLYSFTADPSANRSEQRHWANPLESPLPYAPDLKIFCFYGVGRETERGYFYRHTATPTPSPPENSLVPHWSINSSHTAEELNIRSGVKFTDGDGTVPLLSLGYMCSAGWKGGRRLNPGNSTIITREYLEVNATMAILRAATSTDHVDIMGNSEIIRDVIRVVGVKRKGRGKEETREEEEEKERRMRQRREDIDRENEGSKGEEKGPRPQPLREEERKADAIRQQPMATAGEGGMSGGQGEVVGGAGESEWEYTYIGVRDRVLSCVREISAEAQRRWLSRYGEMSGAEVERRVQETLEQKATQDPYGSTDKGRKAAAAAGHD